MSRLPEPSAGLVIRYAYLWKGEHGQGRNEGVKHRPCAIVIAVKNVEGERRVTVVPITHTPPTDPRLAMELPLETKRRLGLDEDRSWVMLNEANQFDWPGTDLAPTVRGDLASIAYGTLPMRFLGTLRGRFIELILAKRVTLIPRDE